MILSAQINPGIYYYIHISSPALHKNLELMLEIQTQALVMMKEPEGFTFIVEESAISFRMDDTCGPFSWISVTTVTDLKQLGITAAISQILARHNISCNVIAGYFHDHLLVPLEQAASAVSLVDQLCTES